MYYILKLLADLSYLTGVIGYQEYSERCEIADWLMNNESPDPRFIEGEISQNNRDNDVIENDTESLIGKKTSMDSSKLEITMLSKWVFTQGDVDCYPSVPHGHLYNKTNEWPKLNPYNGRVFSSIHQEDIKKRLDKNAMKILWNDPKFVEHCRKQVFWYSQNFPHYIFSNAKKGRHIFPRW